MRLVDADALKEDCRMANDCKDCKTYVRDCEYDRIYAKMDFCGWLDDAPTVEAVPVKHGRWTDDNACQFCGFQPWYEHDIHTLSYCPNCGARMDGDNETKV